MKTAAKSTDNKAETETSPKEEFSHFINDTTAHGIKQIFEKEHSILRRCLWAVFVLTALVGLTWMIIGTYNDVFKYPFKTVSNVKMTSPLPFPSVTVCNMNVMDLTKLTPEKAAAVDAGIKYLTASLVYASDNADGQANDTDNLPTLDDVFLKEPASGLFEEAALNVSDFIVSCMYNSRAVDCSTIFTPYQHFFDRCFVLNATKLAHATRRTSLRLGLFVNEQGYMSATDKVGVKFHVHAPGDVPDMMMARHVASPGYSTDVALKVMEHRYLPHPYKAFGDSYCVDTETSEFRSVMDGPPELYVGSKGSPYSLDTCMVSRGLENATALCNCSLESSPSFPRCNLIDLTQCLTINYINLLDMATDNGHLFGCPRPCHVISYTPTISSLHYPSASSINILREMGLFKGNLSYVRKNLLELNIHFDGMTVFETIHVPEYESMTIMGLLGGNMGFFLGASVLTVAEILDFVFCVLKWSAIKGWRRLNLIHSPSISHSNSNPIDDTATART